MVVEKVLKKIESREKEWFRERERKRERGATTLSLFAENDPK